VETHKNLKGAYMSEKYSKTIYIYGDGIGKVEYVDHMASDLTVVNSARVSFGKHKELMDLKDQKLIKYLIKHKHTSTLEHNNVTFRFKVPLYVRSQHHRHRTWKYNEISRRYTDFNIEFYEPTQFRTQHKSNRQASNEDELVNPNIYSKEFGYAAPANLIIQRHHEKSLQLFNELIDKGVCREQARGVLPQNMYTEYYATADLNNLLKFIGLRTHEGAQWEIQKAAEACLEIAEDLWPVTVRAYREINKEGK
jgi:thymidylate synthase (FAD)